MSSRAVRTIAAVIGIAIGAALVHYTLLPILHVLSFVDTWVSLAALTIVPLTGGIILYWTAPSLLRGIAQVAAWLEWRLTRVPLFDILLGSIGLILGLIIAAIFGGALARIPIVGSYLAILTSALLGYLGWTVAIKKRDDIYQLIPRIKAEGAKEGQVKPKLLDTSVIIDGRIADVYATGFLEGPLIVPQFVLDELRHIADSADSLKRNRGRRGLDVLNRLQKQLQADVRFLSDGEEQGEVDTRLVNMAKDLNGYVLTNDFNLNKVAELQGVPVLNINDLANALRPVVLPGETIHVQVIREGKEADQGVGYLEDGTMIVVEGGKKHLGEEIEVSVTSVLQTSAGRMVFARSKEVAQRVS